MKQKTLPREQLFTDINKNDRINFVNTMAADALAGLAPCITRSSISMVLTILDKLVLAFQEEVFQPPTASQYQEMIERQLPSNLWYKLHLSRYKIIDHSYVVGASPVGTAPTTSFST